MKRMWKIKRNVLDSVKLAAANVYPDEFLALLGGDKEKKVIDEMVVPQAIYGRNFSSLRLDLVPFDGKILGSIHSHPSQPLPSHGDLVSFSRLGVVHGILGYPFTDDDIKFFDSKGKELKYQIVK